MLLLLNAALAADPQIDVKWSAFVARLVITAGPGEHVNESAPAWFGNGSDEVRGTGGLAWARLPFVAGNTLTASIPVCNDDGSKCRIVEVSGRSTSGVASGKMRLLPAEDRRLAPRAPTAAAKVYDFGAVWCPPCNLLRAEVIDDPADAEAIGGVEIIYVDADKPESWPLKSKYHVTGYPTLVAVDAAGNEVDRLLGYDSELAALAWFNGLASATPVTTLEAPPALDSDPTQAARNALRLARMGKKDAAKRWLGVAADNVDSRYARLLMDPKPADADWLQANAADGDWIPVALAAFPDRWSVLAPRVPGLEADDVVASLDAYAGTASPDAALVARVALTALVWKQMGTDAEASRGHIVDLTDGLASIGNLPRALGILAEYSALYPAEFTWDFSAARLLLDAKRFPEAEAKARSCLEKAWGDQRLRAVQRLARTLDAQGKRADAVALLKLELAAATKPGPEVDVRTSRYLGEVEALIVEFGG